MASLSKELDRGYVCWRIRFFLQDKWLSLRLGKINKRSAEEVTRHLRELIRASETGSPAPVDTVNWAVTVDRKLQEKLVECNLYEPVSPIG